MEQEMMKISKKELDNLKVRAKLNDKLLVKLVKGLEDVRFGKVND